MKALLIAPISPDFNLGYHNSIARALTKFGFETQIAEFYFITPPGLVNRVRIDAAILLGYRKYYEAYVASFNQEVMARYMATRPDLVLVIRGSKVTEATLEAMAASVRVLWCQDAVRRSDINLDQLRCYDRRYVFDASDVSWLAEHCNLSARFLPMAFDPEVYHPLPQTVRDIDVFFVGGYYPGRRAILESLVRHFPSHTLRFYGRYVRYREPATWGRFLYYIAVGQGRIFVNQSLEPIQVNRMYARSKICINMHHAQSTLGCNPRVFEIMGSGAFQLVDAIPYVRENLGDILVTYEGCESLLQAIAAYLPEDRLRHEISQKARQIAFNHHTYAHRVPEILRDCNLTAIASP
jgi:spore maturation protein CgeB